LQKLQKPTNRPEVAHLLVPDTTCREKKDQNKKAPAGEKQHVGISAPMNEGEHTHSKRNGKTSEKFGSIGF
jgi:hypothetical protein